MLKVLKKLIEFLPVSRRKYMELLNQICITLNGLVEAEANHCQIETNIIQQLQKQSQQNMVQKPSTKKNGSDPAFQ